MTEAHKRSVMTTHVDNFPIFEVKTEYPNGTNVIDFRRPNLPLYIRIALINLYDENCELKRSCASHSSAKSEAVLDELIQEIGSIVLLDGKAIETRKLILDIIKDKKVELRSQQKERER